MRRHGSTPLAALVALVALAALSACRETRPPDVVIITVDTLRADHVGVYDADSSTPRIDALARDATVFERCAAPMPLTRPSHFSLLTSLYPREHGVLNNAMVLPDESVSLTEILDGHGYRTGGFVGVRLLGPGSGADQGFGFFDQPHDARERRAEAVVERALEWLDGLRPDERFLLWVHVFDPHLPYDAPEPFRGDVAPDRPPLSWDRLVEIAEQHDGDVPGAVLERGKKMYRGEVAYVDHWIGELIDGLGKRRPLDRTLVVFTADHGECFENGVYFEHADCLAEPGIRIPLIVRYPPMFRPGARVLEQTSIVDVAPTVLRAAGYEVPEGLSGRALQDLDPGDDRHVLVQYPFYQPSAAGRRPARLEAVRTVAGEPTTPILLGVEKVGVVGREWKYLRTGADKELYAMEPVADERNNRLASSPDAASRMESVLNRELAAHPLNLIETPEINEELLETLKALGYL